MRLSQTVWAWRAENREKMTVKMPMVPFQQKNPSKKPCFSTPPTKNNFFCMRDNETGLSQGENSALRGGKTFGLVTVGCRVPPLPRPQSGLVNFFRFFLVLPPLGGEGVALATSSISMILKNFLRRTFLYLCWIRLRRTVWPLFAAEGVIFGDFCRSRGFNGHLGREGVVQSIQC